MIRSLIAAALLATPAAGGPAADNARFEELYGKVVSQLEEKLRPGSTAIFRICVGRACRRVEREYSEPVAACEVIAAGAVAAVGVSHPHAVVTFECVPGVGA